MFEQFGFEEFTARQATVWLGAVLGIAFGVLAQITRFCLRRAVAGGTGGRADAAGIWLAALAAAVVGTQAAALSGLISFDGHRFLDADMPALAIVVGGLMFGAGMTLTRGCVSRLAVLTGSGNLRALMVLIVFAVVAHATLKGVAAPFRVALGGVTTPLGGFSSFAALPGGAVFWSALIAVGSLFLAARSGAGKRNLALAGIIGLLVPAGWVGVGYVLHDEFDPVALQSLSFTAPAADTLFFAVASSSIAAGFGVGLFCGAVGGAFASAVARGEFRWQSFESPAQTGRYLAGAALMGVGGVLAGGCTVGAGLSGVSTLSFAAVLAVSAIAAGGWGASTLIDRQPTRPAIPAKEPL